MSPLSTRTQMRHMKDRLEDRADSKVNILLQSMKKRKRPRKDDDEDELDENDLLKAAIEEKDLKIEVCMKIWFQDNSNA